MFWFFVFALVCVVFILFFLLYKSDKSTINADSQKIIYKFEPNTVVSPLSDMIDYHKNNLTVRYKM